ncbi:MAG: MFS transporter [Chloroflexi bacterium]|nr:MFS transporter [Chloroflexota bacterium]
MITWIKFPKIFFGWWTVLAGTWLNFWGSAYTVYGFSALFKPLSSELGFSRAATSVASGISRFESGFLSPLVGWLVDKFGPKWVILFGVYLFSLALILMYFVNSLWTFYLVWGLILGTGQNFSAHIPIDKAITNWFVRKRGLALGIRWIASGVIILPILTWLITNLGWRTTCLIGGIVAVVVGTPIVFFSIRQHRPEYYGLLPDGATAKDETAVETSQMIDKGIKYAAEVEEIEFDARQALRTPAFWLLTIVSASQAVATGTFFVHAIPFLTDMNIEPVKAATIVTIAGLFGIAARLIGGITADRLRKGQLRFLFIAALLLQATGFTIIVLRQTSTMAYPFLIFSYAGFGLIMVLTPMIGGRYFGRKAFGSIRGLMVTFAMPSAIAGPIYAGWIYDTTDSYSIAFITAIAISAFAAVLMFLARPPKPPAKITDIRLIA